MALVRRAAERGVVMDSNSELTRCHNSTLECRLAPHVRGPTGWLFVAITLSMVAMVGVFGAVMGGFLAFLLRDTWHWILLPVAILAINVLCAVQLSFESEKTAPFRRRAWRS